MNDYLKEIVMKKIDEDESINTQIDNELSIILGKDMRSKMKRILVLSGGGVKGIAHLGALKALEVLGILKNIHTFTGTSVGALISVLIAIGYSPDELYNFITVFDIKKMKSMNPDSILQTYGLDDGQNILFVLEKLFAAKGIESNITFGQLFKLTKKTVITCASCVNDKTAYYFSHKTNPDMSVLTAVRMSIAIPIYFTPVIYEDKMFIDGGCIDNYPIQLFADDIDSVIGIYLTSVRETTKDVQNIESFLMNLVQCLFEGVTCNSLKGFEKQSIKISLHQNGPMELDLSNEKKKELFSTGYNAVIERLS